MKPTNQLLGDSLASGLLAGAGATLLAAIKGTALNYQGCIAGRTDCAKGPYDAKFMLRATDTCDTPVLPGVSKAGVPVAKSSQTIQLRIFS